MAPVGLTHSEHADGCECADLLTCLLRALCAPGSWPPCVPAGAGAGVLMPVMGATCRQASVRVQGTGTGMRVHWRKQGTDSTPLCGKEPPWWVVCMQRDYLAISHRDNWGREQGQRTGLKVAVLLGVGWS